MMCDHPSWHSGVLCSGCPVNTCKTNSLSLGLWTSLWGITIFTAELKPTSCVRAVWRAVMTASYVYLFSRYANWCESRSAGMAALIRTRMSLSKHLFIVGVGASGWQSIRQFIWPFLWTNFLAVGLTKCQFQSFQGLVYTIIHTVDGI